MDDVNYLPPDADPYGRAPYEGYPDAPGAWPSGRHRATGQPGAPSRQVDGARQRMPASERRAPGYPPRGTGQGSPPPGAAPRQANPPGGRPTAAYSGPMRAYQPGNSGPMRAYQPGSGPMPAYQPENGGPMRAYQPGNSGPMRAYQPGNSGPMRAYQPGNSGPMRAYQPDGGPMTARRPRGGSPAAGGYPGTGGYPVTGGFKHASTGLLAGSSSASSPAPARQADSGPMVATRTPPAGVPAREPISDGKRLAGWVPFTNRLVLLPKEASGTEVLREHRDVDGGGWLRPAVFGAMDGLVTNASLIAGIGGGGGGHGTILLTGIAGIIAGAFSMATGEYISVGSQNELTLAEVELERKQHARDPEGKQARLTEIYMEKGVSPNLAEAVVRQISADPERAIEAHVREELGIDPDDLPSPRTAAVASFASFTVGALLPLAPFLVGYPNLIAGLAIAGVSAFAGGAALSKITGRPPFLGGFRQFTAAFLATGMAFLIGHLVGAHVG